MNMLWKIYLRAKKYTPYIILSVLAVLFTTGLGLVAPMFVRELIKKMEAGISSDDTGFVIRLGLILLGLYALRVGARFINSYFSHKAAWSYVNDIRVSLYNHLQSLSLSFYSDKQTGQLMSRVISDTSNFEVLIAHAVPDTIASLLSFFGVAAFLIYINPTLALLTCIPLPFVFIGAVIFAKKLRPTFRKAQRYTGELSGNLQDNFSGIKEIQVFNRQETGSELIKNSSEKHIHAILGALKLSAFFHPSIEFFSSLGTIIVIIFGGIMAATNQGVTSADLVAFLLYLSMFYAPIMTLSRVVEDFQNAMASGERVFEILDVNSDIKESADAKPLVCTNASVEFNDVSFSYVKEQSILKNISFTAEGGKMLAIAGPTGVGKTTLISLLMRFYDVNEGAITIDGQDVRSLTLQSLRENMSIVLQDTFLFNGTIEQNLAFAKKNATPQEIYEAAKKARIHDEILKMPDGYNTMVGERGMRLSGGQKQRLSIARAILRNSPILILDEATASVDVETETKIQEAINEVSKSRTIIIIAHRLSTIKKADKIIVLEDGKVLEQGTHETLIDAGGLYSKLTFLQTTKDAELAAT